MTKNLFFGMFAAAGLLLATSCSNDELNEVQTGDMTSVSFTVGVEDAVQTRAISDGSQIDKFTYRVFDENGAIIYSMGVEGQDFLWEEGKRLFSLRLEKGKKYTFVFWAYSSKCTAYTINEKAENDNGMTVTVNYEDAANNDESRDAFFKAHTFTVTDDNLEQGVTLYRPFAQLNFAVPTDEFNKAKEEAKYEVKKSSVTIKNVPNTIDLLTGSVSGAAEITYTLGDIPTDFLYFYDDGDDDAEDGDGGNDDGSIEKHTWLSMSYILANDESEGGNAKALLERATFTISDGHETSPTEFSKGLTDVPVRRNYRTNIIAKGFMPDINYVQGDVSFKIWIHPAYNNSENGNNTKPENNYNGPTFEMGKIDLGIKVGGATEGKTLYFGSRNLGADSDYEIGDYYTYNEALEEVKKLGEGWRLPTYDELKALLDNNLSADKEMWINDYEGTGAKGYKRISESDGKTFFLPAGGRFYNPKKGEKLDLTDTDKVFFIAGPTSNDYYYTVMNIKAGVGAAVMTQSIGSVKYNDSNQDWGLSYKYPIRPVYEAPDGE